MKFDENKVALGWEVLCNEGGAIDVQWTRCDERDGFYDILVKMDYDDSDEITYARLCGETNFTPVERQYEFGDLTPDQALHLIYNCPMEE